MGLNGFLEGLSTFIEKLERLAEKGEALRESGEIRGRDGNLKGVYGFSIKVGLGQKDLQVEPFGNVREDKQTGMPVVTEEREPMVDVMDEENHVLVIAEMPGVSEEDVKLEIHADVLTVTAERGEKKYRKEVLLPRSFSTEQMAYTCRNGLLEVKLQK